MSEVKIEVRLFNLIDHNTKYVAMIVIDSNGQLGHGIQSDISCRVKAIFPYSMFMDVKIQYLELH